MANTSIACKKFSDWLLWLAISLWPLLVTTPAAAQSPYGNIVGSVTDSTGALLPGTIVKLTDLGQNTTRLTTTNDAGIYQFFDLQPASYRLDVTHAGFQHLTRSPLVLQTQASLKVDFVMVVGSEAQTVSVSGETPLLQPETSSLGQVIDERETNELPLNGRNPMNLAALVPSVVPQGGALEAPNGQNPFAWGNYQIGGGFANQSSTYLDGSPVNAEYLNVTALVPTQDSIGEFKVTTNNLPPEYGRLAGGVIAFSTKSGTNRLHGSLWEFIRNKVFNANDYFSNQAGLERPPFTQNQFGLNVGGPVTIPHVYNGHSRTFFFFDWEDFQLRQGQTFVDTFPTAAERTGDLSGLGVPIYDPLTTCGASDTSPCPPGTAQYSRTQFSGNVIPANRLNPVALKVMALYFPLPNTAGVNGQNNFITNTSAGGGTNEFVGHIDHDISDKNHLSARYTYWDNMVLPDDPLRNGECVGTCTQTFTANNFVLGDSHTFNSNTVLDTWVSYQRFVYLLTPKLMPYDLSQIGLPSALNTELNFDMLPLFGITGIDQAGINSGGVINDYSDNDRVASKLIRVLKRHTLSLGFDYSYGTYNIIQSGAGSFGLNFDQGLTSSNPLSPVGGAGLASFELGYPASGSTPYDNMVAASQKWGGVFANDDWHVSDKLTFNAGMRWEYDAPWTERHNRLSYFDPKAVNPLLASAGLSYPGSTELVDSGSYGDRSNVRPDWKQFSPRIGFGYQVLSKTVVHGAYGIFWLPTDLSNAASPNTDSINSISTSYIASTDGGSHRRVA
jgi:hypothetical protein